MKKFYILISLLVLAGMVLAACGGQQAPQTVVVTKIVEQAGEKVVVTQVVEVIPTPPPEPVVLDINWGTEPPTADPALATDTTSVAVTGQMFMGLTKFDPKTGEVTPWLAESWEVSDDGTVFTFHLRKDIPWVKYNTATGEVELVTDDNGNPRYVNAHDVEYAVKRTLDPATASDYAYVLYIIKNAQAFNEGAEGVTADDVGVKALDDWTVQFTLESPAAFFPAIVGMWVASPVPQWVIEAAGDKWTEPGTIVTNGPYVMTEWVHGSELNMKRNPYWPLWEANGGPVKGNIDEIHGVMITEESTAFALYENNELDTTGVPLGEIDRVKSDPVLSKEYVNQPELCTYYYGFTNNKPPFDDVRVRKAFIMAVDKQALVDNVLKGGQIPADHFAPPGIFGAPEPGAFADEMPFDPEKARALLQEYLDEKGMTLDDFNALGITLMHNTSEGHAKIAAAIQQMWKDNLGVEVKVENQEWKVYLDTIKKTTPLEDMPHIWRLGWCADYPDENNWVYEVFNNQAGANRLRRGCLDETCTEVKPLRFDELTEQAKVEQDPEKRKELYYEAEHELAVVEAAYLPLYFYVRNTVTKPWLQRDYPPLGAPNYWDWVIDWEAKKAARGG